MSELINNREYRRNVLKELIQDLHNGKTVDEVKQRFEKTFGGVSVSEISEVEQALIADGMPVQEVQRLCDVHAAVFKGSIEQIHSSDPSGQPGHPLNTMKQENRAIEVLIADKIRPHLEELKTLGIDWARIQLKKDFEKLADIDIHYGRKENILFPYLEKNGITAPPKVMWGVHDEIRDLIKDTIKAIDGGDIGQIEQKAEEAINRALSEMS
ncbi:MAG TPA: DUF438 domain-containing protein, partial [Clostridia bacterium]|nr:DUF438 domain-containing protein [Clostridia bacterium]